MTRFVEVVRRLVLGGSSLLALSTACAGAQKSEPRDPPRASSTQALHRAEKPQPEQAPNKLEVLIERTEQSDATLDLIDIEPAPGTVLAPDDVLRARLRYSVERSTDTKYALYAQFRTPSDTSLFDGSISEESSPPVNKTADVVDITFPLSDVMNDARVAKPIQIKFVLTQYVSAKESIVIAETMYLSYGSS